jgi:antitoxin (DNA-binding transcriptional repressor) of toxin-antitoxin stability system
MAIAMAIKDDAMPHYSVATTKDKLSSLIDKALAGEEVVITRHGKPTVSLHVVQPELKPDKRGLAWLKARREALPPLDAGGVDIVAEMRSEYRY